MIREEEQSDEIYDEQSQVIEDQTKKIKSLEGEVKAAMKIIHEMGRHAAKEVRFTTAEFEAWQKGRT